MAKFKHIKPILWFVLALVFVGQFSVVDAAAKAEPLAIESSESEALFDDSSADPSIDGLTFRMSLPAGTGVQFIYGPSGQFHSKSGIACVIPDPTGPPGSKA